MLRKPKNLCDGLHRCQLLLLAISFACDFFLDDMDQMYDMWLSQNAHSRQTDEAVLTKRTAEEKKTVMPTDDAESLVCMLSFLDQKAENIFPDTKK